MAILHLSISQSEFGRRLGSSPGFVSDVVRGLKKPGAEFLLCVKQIFGISTARCMAVTPQAEIDRITLDNVNLFRHRFGFEAPRRRVREQVRSRPRRPGSRCSASPLLRPSASPAPGCSGSSISSLRLVRTAAKLLTLTSSAPAP
ncbi:helix-turn-helix transcriptional regulator [Thiobacillus sp.]|uniref:helix-turn-helix domain-containing protein n=1 Tax=Thiobacillus sp. TaxID=924 RepID=UPI0025D01D8D|nr:helix-turn-helix transcriptional regulator [Thiobacillus sp.]